MQVEVLSFDRLKGTYTPCPDFSIIYSHLSVENRNYHVNFVIHDGFLFRGSKLCIPKLSFRDFLVWEMHAKGLAGHLGKDRTITLVAIHFYWTSLKRDVDCIVSQCRTSQLAKTKRHNIGLYTPFPIPHALWKDISIDFVLGLPRTSCGLDSILVVVDRSSKMARFITYSKTDDASLIGKLVFQEVVRLHGLPTSIVSGRDVKFISYFWKTLRKLCGTTQKFSAAFHPQTDGQTKVVNRSLGELHRCIVGEK